MVKLPVSEFQYFGDGWEHTIEIENLVVPSAEGKRIQCVAGENACPPEDIGGPHAYFDFLAASVTRLTRNITRRWNGSEAPSIPSPSASTTSTNVCPLHALLAGFDPAI
jgi:hypothetical protein